MVLGLIKFHMDGEQLKMRKLLRKRSQLMELLSQPYLQMLEEHQNLSLFSIAKKMLHMIDSLIKKLPKLNVLVSLKRDRKTERHKEKKIVLLSLVKFLSLLMQMKNQLQKKSKQILTVK